MTAFLPLVSARNPQKCELTIIPTDAAADSTPLCSVDNCKSHSATGKTKLIPVIEITFESEP